MSKYNLSDVDAGTFSVGRERSTVELQTPGWKEIEIDVIDGVTCSDPYPQSYPVCHVLTTGRQAPPGPEHSELGIATERQNQRGQSCSEIRQTNWKFDKFLCMDVSIRCKYTRGMWVLFSTSQNNSTPNKSTNIVKHDSHTVFAYLHESSLLQSVHYNRWDSCKKKKKKKS